MKARDVLFAAVASSMALGFAGSCGGEDFTVAPSPVAASGGAGGSQQTGGAAGASGAGVGGKGIGGGGTGGSGGGGTGGSGGGGTGGSGIGGSGVGGGLPCPGEQICAEVPPPGWISLGWMSSNVATPCANVATQLYEPTGLPRPSPAVCACSCDVMKTRCAATLSCAPQPTACWDGGYPRVSIESECGPVTPPGPGNLTCGIGSATGIGTCPPVPSKTLSPVGWAPNAMTCVRPAMSGAACGDGGVCAPARPAGAVGPCIVASGDVPCPAGYGYQKRTVLYQSYDDGRDCTFACSCSDAHLTCACTMGVCRVELADSCTTTPFTTIPADNVCHTVYPSGGSSAWVGTLIGYSAPAGGTCSPTGTATPLGAVVPTGPETVCCVL